MCYFFVVSGFAKIIFNTVYYMRALKQIFGKHRAQAVKMINTYRYLVTQIIFTGADEAVQTLDQWNKTIMLASIIKNTYKKCISLRLCTIIEW